MTIATKDMILNAYGYANATYPGSTRAVDPAFDALINLYWPLAEKLVKKFLGYDPQQKVYDEFYPEVYGTPVAETLVDGYEGSAGKVVPIDRYRDSGRILQLRALPVRSVQFVWENPDAWQTFPPAWPDEAKLTEGGDFVPDYRESSLSAPGSGDVSWTGFLVRRSGVWYVGERSIRVQYTAGFTAAELLSDYPEFQIAVVTSAQFWIAQTLAQRVNPVTGSVGGAITGESLRGWSISYDASTAALNQGLQMELPVGACRLLEDYVRIGKYL